LTEAEVRKLLDQKCQEAGGRREFARLNKMSAAYVIDVINGSRGIGPKIRQALGLKVEYRKVEE
jgi:hypothetical protein